MGETAARANGMWDDAKWYRYGFLAGIVFVVLNVIAFFLTEAPPARDASAEKIAKFFLDNDSGIKVSAILFGFSLIFAVWWLGSLWRAISGLEPGGPRLALIAVIGMVMSGSIVSVGQALYVTPALRPDTLGGTSEVVWAVTNAMFSLVMAVTAVHLLALAALVLWKKFLPVWMGYGALVGAVSAAIAVIGAGTESGVFAVFTLIGYLLWLLWVLLASILLYRSTPAA